MIHLTNVSIKIAVIVIFMLFSPWMQAQQQTLSGDVFLPNNAVADGATQIDIDIEIVTGFSNPTVIDTFSTTITIPDQDNQAAYSITYDALPDNNSSFRIRYGCNFDDVSSNCGRLTRGVFYTPTGPTYDESSSEQSSLPANLDLELFEAQGNATGSVTLGGQTSTQNIEVLVTARSLRGFQDDNFEFQFEVIASNSQVVTISASTLSADFDLMFAQGGFNLSTQFSYVCQTNCGGFSSDEFVLAQKFINGQRVTRVEILNENLFSVQAFLNFASSTNLELPLFETQVLSGNIVLPVPYTGFFTGQALGLTVRTHNASGDVVAQSSLESVPISNGQTSGAYSLAVPTLTGGHYTIEYGCPFLGFPDIECGTFVETVFYAQAGPVYLKDQAEQISALPSMLDLPMVDGLSFSFSLELETGTASETISPSVFVAAYSSDGNFIGGDHGDFQNAFSRIAQGESSSGVVQTSVGAPPIADGDGFHRIIITCGFMCGDILSPQFYTPSGNTVFGFNNPANQISLSDFPTGVNTIKLRRGERLSGSISLPSVSTATGNVPIQVSLQGRDANGDTLFVASDFVSVDSSVVGASVDYDILYSPEGVANYFLTVSCNDLNCGDIAPTTYFTTDGATTGTSRNSFNIAAANLPSTADFALSSVVLQNFNVQAQLPAAIASGDIAFDVTIFPLDSSGVALTGVGLFPVVSSGTTVAPIVSDMLEESPSGQYRVTFFCDSATSTASCDDYIVGSPSYVFTVSEDSIPDPIIVELVAVPVVPSTRAFNIDARIPEALSEGDVTVDITIFPLDSSGNTLSGTGLAATVNTGNILSNTEMATTSISPAGQYRITFFCDAQASTASCDEYELAAPSYTFTVAEGSIPDLITVALLQAPVIIQPDSFEVDDTALTASTINRGQRQQHTIHIAGDVDFAKFTLTEIMPGEPIRNIRIEVVSSPSTSNMQIILRDAAGVEVATDTTEIDTQESANSSLSAIDVDSLPAGEYTIQVNAFSLAEEVESYTLRLNYDGDDETCFPIPTKNGAVAIVCL